MDLKIDRRKSVTYLFRARESDLAPYSFPTRLPRFRRASPSTFLHKSIRMNCDKGIVIHFSDKIKTD